MNDENLTTFSVEVKVKKDIPKKEIKQFEDRSVYYTVVLTREITKGARAYPHLTGELERQEIRSPIYKRDHAKYGLLRGTKYASYVYKMTNVKWTNPATRPRWYDSMYRQKQKVIVETAQNRALKEINQ
jgi:hypothetical protein